MISRKKIISKSRDDINLLASPPPDDSEDVWYQKEKLFRVSNYCLVYIMSIFWLFEIENDYWKQLLIYDIKLHFLRVTFSKMQFDVLYKFSKFHSITSNIDKSCTYIQSILFCEAPLRVKHLTYSLIRGNFYRKPTKFKFPLKKKCV